MPHMDGFAILEALRAKSTGAFLPVIVLTADIDAQSKYRALRAGATDYLLKPFDYIEVLLRIRNLLETRRIHQLLENRPAALEEAIAARTSELYAARAELDKVRRPGVISNGWIAAEVRETHCDLAACSLKKYGLGQFLRLRIGYEIPSRMIPLAWIAREALLPNALRIDWTSSAGV